MNGLIEVEVREVFGVPKAYPANDAARHLAAIAGTETLTARVIALAKKMGFEICEKRVSRLAAVA